VDSPGSESGMVAGTEHSDEFSHSISMELFQHLNITSPYYNVLLLMKLGQQITYFILKTVINNFCNGLCRSLSSVRY
jgi:hypothetical protein